MRLGMVGSDLLHALEYAAIINAPDEDRVAKPAVDHGAAVGGMPPPAYGRPDVWDPPPVTGRQVRHTPAFQGARVVTWWGHDQAQAARWAEQAGVPHVARSTADMVDKVDAALICTWHGRDHAELARPFLAAGLPVFIDKPLTESVAEARLLIDLAEQQNTFLFSSSPWRWAPAVVDLRRSLEQLGEGRACAVTGPDVGGPYFYTVHLVETALSLYGPGIAAVRATESAKARVITAEYGDGRMLQLAGLKQASAIRNVTVFGQKGHLGCDITDAQKDVGMFHLLRAFLEGVRSGQPPEPHAAALEVIAVLDAAAEAVRQSGGLVRPEPRGGASRPVAQGLALKERNP